MKRTRAAANWGTTTLAHLRTESFRHRHMTSAFEWLKVIGLVPEGVARMDVRQVVELDPDSVPVSYIAASAFEWDTWGESSPVDFIKAISAEARGAKRDLIIETLTALGNEQKAVAA